MKATDKNLEIFERNFVRKEYGKMKTRVFCKPKNCFSEVITAPVNSFPSLKDYSKVARSQ